MKSDSQLFETLNLAGLPLRNRIVMAPMTTWASNDDGTVSDAEDAYYRLRVKGIGLVITGCTHVQANGIGFTGEFAADDDRFIRSLKKLAEAAKSGGAPAILQIFHAGVKAIPELVSEVVAASAVPGDASPFAATVTPRALTEAEVLDAINAFGQATRRAIEAGFDGIELHGAHGFLIQNFFSPHFNKRTDQWGGSLNNRMRFPLAVISEVRRVITQGADRPFVLGYRISVDEPTEDGLRIEDSLRLIDGVIASGADYVHVSLSDALTARPVGEPDGPTIVRILVDHIAGRVPLIAAGQIRTAEQARRALKDGLSLVAIGQGLIMNPDWVEIAKHPTSAVALELDPGDIAKLSIPQKLWTVIQAMTGWFKIRQPTMN
jgi:2,4-dienoyl-CoA reductase-like NADH-dependent reductase (Old Yellow Enzyme family)